VISAKREVRPELHDALKEAKFLVERSLSRSTGSARAWATTRSPAGIYTLIAG
jgi:hypothetical protein